MAESMAAVENGLDCPICLQRFNDPRILPCGHSGCFRCIQRYSEETNGSIECPRCRLKMQPGDVENIMKNYDLAHVCSEIKAEKSEAKPFCKKHREKLSVYCETCEKLFCEDGVHEHKGHIIGDIDEQYGKMEPQLEETILKLQRMEKEIGAALEKQQIHLDRADENERTITKTVQKCFRDLQANLDERRDEIRRSIEEKMGGYQQPKLKQKTKLEKSRRKLQSHIQSCNQLLRKSKEYIIKECQETIESANEGIEAAQAIPLDVIYERIPFGSIHCSWANETIEHMAFSWEDSDLGNLEQPEGESTLKELIEKAREHTRLKDQYESLKCDLNTLRQDMEQKDGEYKRKEKETSSLQQEIRREKENNELAETKITKLEGKLKRQDETIQMLLKERNDNIKRWQSVTEEIADVFPGDKRHISEDTECSPKLKSARREDTFELDLQEKKEPKPIQKENFDLEPLKI